MKTAIGRLSAIAAQAVAWVWNRKLPMPMMARMAQSRRAVMRPPVRRHMITAAIRKAALVMALMGSAQ